MNSKNNSIQIMDRIGAVAIPTMLVALMLVTGCTTKGTISNPVNVDKSPATGVDLKKPEKFHVDSRLLQRCDPSAKLPEDQPVFSEDILQAFGKTSNSLKNCTSRHQELVNAVCKYFADGDLCKKP